MDMSMRRALSSACAAMVVATIAAGCSTQASSETDAATQEPTEATSSPAPAVARSEQPQPSDEGSEDGAGFEAVNGRWCPVAESQWEDGCLEIDLPSVRRDDYPDIDAYVYPPSSGGIDPTQLTGEDYRPEPARGQCFGGVVDVYPSASGAALIFCPAGALGGEEWIDDPVASFADTEGPGARVVDHTDEDRLSITQEETPFPYVRSGE